MVKNGLPADDAAKVAELMLEADLIGADAHGVFRLPQYVQRLKLGSTNPRPNIKVKQTAPATALVDGDNGMGHLVVSRAAETAIELARDLRRRLGRRAHVQPRGRGRRLRRAAAQGQHDRHLFGAWPTPTTCRSSAAPSRCSAPIRWRLRSPPAKSRRWCSTLPPRSCPTAPSRTTDAQSPAQGRLDGRSQNRRGGHRSAEKRRGAAAADGRLQGRGAGADPRHARRHAQRRALRPRLPSTSMPIRPPSPIPGNS